jgi:hypothetical protein
VDPEKGKYIFVAKWVDDFIGSYYHPTMYQDFQKAYNEKQFEYLGTELEQLSDHSIKVSMAKMTTKILSRHNIQTKSTSPSSLDLFTNKDGDGNFSDNVTDFKSRTYELMYLDKVRIDIKKECNELASLSNHPRAHSYKKLDKVYSYFNATKDDYIILGADNLNLTIYTDASWATHSDPKSHSGIFVTLGNNGGPILVKSYKQKLVSNSSSEAEIATLVVSIKKCFPLMKIMEDIKLNKNMKAIVMEDNTSTNPYC